METPKNVFSIGVSKKYLATLLDCVIRKNDRGWARTHAITGVIGIWISVGISFLGHFIIPSDPRDVGVLSVIFLAVGTMEFWKAFFWRVRNRGYLVHSESIVPDYKLALLYLDMMAVVRKCQETGTEPPKEILDTMRKVQKRFDLPYFNQDRDGADEIIVTERLTGPS